jgi:hypothetical protein
MRRILVVAAGVLATAIAVALMVRQPMLAPLVIAVIVATLVLALRPAWSIYLTLVLAFTALPAVIPTEFNVAGNTIRAHEPMLFFATIFALVKFRASKRTNLLALAFALFIAVGLAIGFAEQHALAKVVYDARPLLEALAILLVAVRIYGTTIADRCLKVARWVLWISAATVLAGATLGLDVGGRTEEASLSNPLADAGAATRLLTNATFPALAVLCAVVALVVAKRAPLRASWQYTVPSMLIVILSFSRNSLLALGVAIVFAVVATRTTSALIRASAIGAAAVAVFSLLLLLNPVLAGLPGGDFVNTQVSSYASRVVDGLSSNVQATDSSVQFRASEDAYLMRGIASSPVIGHGFGFAYKPSAGSASFTLDYAPYFAHNFYLWAAVKAGAVGLGLFVVSVASPLWRATRASQKQTLGLASALMGMLAASVVAPVPLSATSALLFGLLVGALAKATDNQAAAHLAGGEAGPIGTAEEHQLTPRSVRA